MNTIFRSVLAAACVATLPLAAQAQTRKPAAKPVAKPAAKPMAKPAAATPAPRPAPAPAPTPAPAAPPARKAAASSSSGDPFEVGTNALNIGIGFGSRYSFGTLGYGYLGLGGSSSVSPAFSVSFERGIIQAGPGVVGAGIFVGYQGASYDYGGGDKLKYRDIVVMLRGAFHYPVTDKFDAYGGVGLGVRHSNRSGEGLFSSTYTNLDSPTEFASGLFVGGRYYLTPNIGVFSELGYDQSFIKIGLAAKF